MKQEYNKPIDVFSLEMTYSREKTIHSHKHNEIFLTLKGSGEQFTEKGPQKMREGDIFLFPSGQLHYGNGGHDSGCIAGVIYFHDFIFDGKSEWEKESGKVLKILAKGTKKGNNKIRVNPYGRKELFRIFNEMLDENRAKRPGFKSQLICMMHQFMITILRNSQLEIDGVSISDESVILEKINDVLQFLETHYMQNLNIEQISNAAGMSRSYFHANFKKVTGETFVDYLNDLRIKAAEKLLQDKSFSVDTVAFRTGFTSVSHFYKVFKETTGKTPVKYRKESQVQK